MPLQFNSPRASPFQRPSSPGSPSTTLTPAMNRPSTPTHSSPGRGPNHTPTTSPSKLKQSYTAEDAAFDVTASPAPPSPTPTARPFVRSQTEPPSQSPYRSSYPPASPQNAHRPQQAAALDTTLLSRLPPTLVHTLRETFSVLDTNSDNILTPSDILSTFSSLSLPAPSPAEMSAFFPPGSQQSISLPVFLNTLASLLTRLSPSTELINAFSAFDEGDSGEIDVDELRQAMLSSVPGDDAGGEIVRPLSERDFQTCVQGWTGRRAFVAAGGGGRGAAGLRNLNAPGGSAKKGGDIFRYHDFVGNLMAGGVAGEDAGKGASAIVA